MKRNYKIKSNKFNSTLIKVFIGVFLLFIILGSLSGFLLEIQWFKEAGYLNVFFTSFKAKALTFIPCIILLFLLINTYIRFLRKKYWKIRGVVIAKEDNHRENKIINIFSIIGSFILSSIFTGVFWQRLLFFINGTQFGILDPIFKKDAGFYMFKLPLIEGLVYFSLSIVIILFIVTAIFYFVIRARDGILSLKELIKGGESEEARFIGKQLAILGALLLILISLVFYIVSLNLVYSPRGVAVGASYTDVHVTLPMYRVIMVVSLIGAFIVAFSIIRKMIKPIIWTMVVILVLVFSEGVISSVVEKFIVSPNAKEKEMPYLTYNIEFTRKAFNLDSIEERNFPVDYNLTGKDIEENKGTVDNIRINEFSQALDVYNQIQAVRNYYKFNDVDIDRYLVDGNLKQVFVSARELDNSNREAKFQTWQNKHLFYTHGYGAIMSYTNMVNASGLPEFIVKDMPSTGKIEIKRPQIYFGELNNDYVIVGAKNNEIDFPSGDEEKEIRYEGSTGIKLTPFNRLLFAVNYGTFNFMLSDNITGDSRVLMRRNITERLNTIAPFLNYDEDPYLVVSKEGKLYWIVDAYTVSSRFPFSERYNGINYMRNSIKVVIDAYDGTTTFYLSDKNDGVAETIGKIYKGLFKDIKDMPEDLKSHLRYSEDVFVFKAKVYEKYHMDNPSVFYNNGDLWNVAKYKSQDGKDLEAQPVYQLMKLPNDNNETFMLTIPFTVANKENMSGWLSAKMDNEGNTKMTIFKFPGEKAIYGPQQFNSKINTDTSVASLLTLLSQRGSQPILGETNIVPIKNSIIYVRPLYLKSQGRSLPELKKVIVGYGDNVVMEDNIKLAIERLFKLKVTEKPSVPVEPGAVDVKSLSGQAFDLFIKAKDAQMKGDWAAYGDYLKQLEDILTKLKDTTGTSGGI